MRKAPQATRMQASVLVLWSSVLMWMLEVPMLRHSISGRRCPRVPAERVRDTAVLLARVQASVLIASVLEALVPLASAQMLW